MRVSKNEKVQHFLKDLETIDSDMFELIISLREIIFSTYQEVEEKIMYGGILFSVNAEMFSGLFAYKNHVSVEFSNGYLMKDPNKHLEGKGKYRRHLKIKKKEEVWAKEVAYYVKQSGLSIILYNRLSFGKLLGLPRFKRV